MTDQNYMTDVNDPVSEIIIDKYYVVIGVEANKPEAYRVEKITFSKKTAKHQYLDGRDFDWGHAFFYVVKNDEVFCFFSFGPSAGKWKANNLIGKASTCQYPIGEVAQLFIINIEQDVATKIKMDVDRVYKKSNNTLYNEKTSQWEEFKSLDQKYRPATNETCAREAEQILKKHLKERVPSGLGYVKWKNISKKAVNPYAWHEHLVDSELKQYTYPEYPDIGKGNEFLAAYQKANPQGELIRTYTYYLRTDHANRVLSEPMDPIFDTNVESDWVLYEGDVDPLKAYEYF
ncbi:hypothetical protein EC844_101185 [Acinetobacter calcoaceticus]|uniref:Uncharacterized protein n=1 Tax=Acinetobacter calcoaceticus TaxID=471 RepID=A0A4R1Y5F3_ACICA|nr:hypothetical protein EC844_101185 [Acinetobacter calcoaceticus]